MQFSRRKGEKQNESVIAMSIVCKCNLHFKLSSSLCSAYLPKKSNKYSNLKNQAQLDLGEQRWMEKIYSAVGIAKT